MDSTNLFFLGLLDMGFKHQKEILDDSMFFSGLSGLEKGSKEISAEKVKVKKNKEI